MQDALGNAVHLADPSGLDTLNAFAQGFLVSETRALDVLGLAARDDSPIVQACAAALKLFGESPQATAAAKRHLDRADASTVVPSERERRFLEAIRAWLQGDLDRAISLHEEQARLCPRDLASVKIGQYHCFNRGDSLRMLRLAMTAAPAAGDLAPMHGMLAFGFEQSHLLRQAEAAARRAIAMQRREPWAQHALAHVLLTEGRVAEGEAFLDSMADTWTGLTSFMVTHNHWHRALFLIEQLRLDEALALHDSQVWGVAKDYSQDQVGSVSLLARLELAGADVGDRWQDVADHLECRVHDHVQPFLDMHYLYGLARAGRAQADALIESVQKHAEQIPVDLRKPWWDVCLPACRGLLAHARREYPAAARWLAQALPEMVLIGGSHAQRDLFEQIRVDALLKTGQWSAAHQLLQPMANACPESRRLAALLSRLYPAVGLSVR